MNASLYKKIYAATMSLVTIVIVASTFSLKDDPQFQVRSVVAHLKIPFYTIAYATSNTPSIASAINSFVSDENQNNDSGDNFVPVLVYHGILTKPDGSAINITEKLFKEQIFALKKAGYETITLDELYKFRRGEISLPEKSIMITFDDGRSDSYYNSDPILAAVNYTAVMFAIGKLTEESSTGGYYLSPDELVLMQGSGRWEIGSHSYDGHDEFPIDSVGTIGHFFGNFLWRPELARVETENEFRSRVENDLTMSQFYLENLLGKPVKSFAFPFGDFGQNQEISPNQTKPAIVVASQFFNMLFYQHRPGEYFSQISPIENNADETLEIKRIDINNNWSGDDLVTELTHGEKKFLPYTDMFDTNQGWIHAWGDYKIEDGALFMAATESQTGSSVILDGSQVWKNYEVSALVESPNQTGVLVWTRFMDDSNNSACNFGTDFVHIEQTIDGQKQVIRGVREGNYIPAGPFTIKAEVSDRTVICSINDIPIVSTEFLDPSLDKGGIGFKIWDEEMGKSSLYIHYLKAEAI